MKIVLVAKEVEKVKELLFKDEIVSRASILFKDGKEFGKEGFVFIVSGTEEQCERAKELVKELAEELKDKEKEEIIKKVEAEQAKAAEGFGLILG